MSTLEKLRKQLDELNLLLADLVQVNEYAGKLSVLNKLPQVQAFVAEALPIFPFLKTLNAEADFAIKSIAAIGQAPVVFNTGNIVGDELSKRMLALLEQLLDAQEFYAHIGGIIGYHATILKLLLEHVAPPKSPLRDCTRYIHPEGLDLEKGSREIRRAVRQGIENIERIAMIYPIGGAGDRLDLRDDLSGTPLPAALLPFLGRSLLEGMIRDVQAYEYLAFKLTGKKSLTPIAIMTSIEKNNNVHILNICKNSNWFGRASENFLFFIQPQVPVITLEGNWSLIDTLTLNIKPSGHGVVWKLAEERGVFRWFESQKRLHCLIRQINNPIAGTDLALLALIGTGCGKQKAFGFLSCDRLLNCDEGTNVLIETKTHGGFEYCLTNIEYTDFAKRGIGEVPSKPGSTISLFPTNTNILFADIASIKKALKSQPIPGQLINLKSKVPYIDPQGHKLDLPGARLESTMQNIADSIVDQFPRKLDKSEQMDSLSSFILYNPRIKTISTTKKRLCPGQSSLSTPEQAFYDLLTNHYCLLQKCQFNLPPWRKFEDHHKLGPACIFLFLPALGPLYSVIAQKIRKGHLAEGSELLLEIAEADIEDLSLKGSLLVYDQASIHHNRVEGRLCLKKVAVSNRGIDMTIPHGYWKDDITRLEAVKIILEEGAEFTAKDVSLEGSHSFEVPARHRLVLSQGANGKLKQELEPIEKPTWFWRYRFDSEDAVQLKKMTT